jgi:hypothetical protein
MVDRFCEQCWQEVPAGQFLRYHLELESAIRR